MKTFVTYRWIAHAASHLIGSTKRWTISAGKATGWAHFHFVRGRIHWHRHAATVVIFFQFQRLGGVKWRWRVNGEWFFMATAVKKSVWSLLFLLLSGLTLTHTGHNSNALNNFFLSVDVWMFWKRSKYFSIAIYKLIFHDHTNFYVIEKAIYRIFNGNFGVFFYDKKVWLTVLLLTVCSDEFYIESDNNKSFTEYQYVIDALCLILV